MRIKNGGVEGAILRHLKDEGVKLSEKEQTHLDFLESLPKNVSVHLDVNHNVIGIGENFNPFDKYKFINKNQSK